MNTPAIKIGTVASVAAAELAPQSIETAPKNDEIAMGSVLVPLPVRIKANINSFQEFSSTMIPVVATPGAVMGIQIFTKVRILEQPSTWAACSSSRGTSWKKPFIISTAKGSCRAVWAKITAR